MPIFKGRQQQQRWSRDVGSCIWQTQEQHLQKSSGDGEGLSPVYDSFILYNNIFVFDFFYTFIPFGSLGFRYWIYAGVSASYDKSPVD